MKDEFGESDLDYEDDDPYDYSNEDIDSCGYPRKTWEDIDNELAKFFKDMY